mmetsp:Transcript_6974/g.20825  ORF Transcript_6974/g.20825 Transcript_6974/m.20825 type:complete len:349 (-) Transcript_6974:27-1073(-)
MRRLMSFRVALKPRFWDIWRARCASSAWRRLLAAAFSAASAAARPAGDCCAVRRIRAAASVAAAAACVSAAAWRVAGTVVRQAPTSVMPSPLVWTQGPPASKVSSLEKSRSSVSGASSSGSISAILAACFTARARWTAAASFLDSQRCSACIFRASLSRFSSRCTSAAARLLCRASSRRCRARKRSCWKASRVSPDATSASRWAEPALSLLRAASVAASAAFFLASSRSAVVASWRAKASSRAKRAWRSWDTRFSRSTKSRRHWCDRARLSSFRKAVAAAISSSGLQATMEFGLVGWHRFAASATMLIFAAQCFWFFGSCGGCAGSADAKLLRPCAGLSLALCVAPQQ